MKTGLVISATALAITFAVATAQAHDPATQRAERLGERLELTGEQQAEVKAIFSEAREQRAALREQAREQRKARSEKSRAIGESTQERLAAVLTEDQSAELSEMRSKMKRRATMKRGKRGAMRGRGMERRREMVRRMLHHRRPHGQTEAPADEQ